jgi:hypothetical protein
VATWRVQGSTSNEISIDAVRDALAAHWLEDARQSSPQVQLYDQRWQSRNLVLLNLPQLPDMGRANPTPQTPDKSWAVVRLPAGCAHVPSPGSTVTATGVLTTEGILNAELVQSDQ